MNRPADDAAHKERIAEPLTAPRQWPWALSAPPMLSSDSTGWRSALLRRWSGTSPVMVQPPLDHHYIAMHLGGAKQVTRRRDAAAVSAVVESGSLTLVPAGTAFVWRTSGPIAFAHLYLRPRQLEDVFGREFDVEGRGASLIERVGCVDPLLQALLGRMTEEMRSGAGASALLLDSLLDSALVELARRHASRSIAAHRRAVALAPHRLQRVLDFVDANLGRSDIGLADLVAAAGSSQFHFSRAFREATGCSPYRYVIRRRIEYARALLMTSGDTLAAVAAKCGFNSGHQFAVMFKREVGIGPKRFSVMYGPRASR